MFREASLGSKELNKFNRSPSPMRLKDTSAKSSSTAKVMIMVMFHLTRSRTQRIIVSEACMTLKAPNRLLKSFKTSLRVLRRANLVSVSQSANLLSAKSLTHLTQAPKASMVLHRVKD